MTQITVAAALAYCRRRAGRSARSVSLEAGLGPAYLSKVETGAIEPSLRSFAKLAKALQMTDREVAIILASEAVAPRNRPADRDTCEVPA